MMFADFRAFVSRGNVIELAVAVVMGTTFGAIVTSLVNDIIMPSARLLTLWLDFSRLNLRIGTIHIAYGNLLQAILTFLLVAWVSFWLVRVVKRMQQRLLGQQPDAPATLPQDTQLLMEIRDLLKAQGRGQFSRRTMSARSAFPKTFRFWGYSPSN
jgi:large conductance mechanosensitive channel